MDLLKKLFALLSRRERRNLYFLFAGVLVMATLQVASVASIMPFLSVASDPSLVTEQPYLRWAYEHLGFTSTRLFLIALGVGSLVALTLSNIFIILTRWATERYAWGRNHTLSRRLLRSYLYRPYEYFLTRNSAELGKNILEEVREITSNMLKPALRGLAKAIVAVFMIGFLVYFDPVVALMVALVLGASYVGVYFVVRGQLDRQGEVRVESNTQRYQFVGEAFGGVKEVKIQGKEESFLEQYDAPSKRFTNSQALYEVIKKIPRYSIEVVAFGGIILIAVYLIAVEENMRQVIPVLGLYAFAGYRLLPALQEAFHGIAGARFNVAALNKLHGDLNLQMESDSERGSTDDIEPLPLNESLALRNVSYTYPRAQQPAVRDLSLEIPAQTMTGFVGQTGSGKTTTVDVLLGLLRPQDGAVEVDGTPLDDQLLPRWKKSIGYVPQDIYMSDDSVARNIAFGVPEEQIDLEAVRVAARRAQILGFVENELPEQWRTTVGERGVQLSGGQRQRIGIARALYHTPSVLVFDEATSALDQSTEASVMQAIYDLDEHLTILIISHRLSTVQRADTVYMLEQGRKVGAGSYEELMSQHSKFRSMALS